jgi:hypothetical protein
MAITIKHAKTDTIADWTQGDLDAQIAAGNFPPGTVLADIVLPSDWNNDHTVSGTIAIANGGTGQTTANAAINALLPSQTGNSGKVLSTNGTDTSWLAAGGTGTVTSVALTAPSIFSVGGSPITAAGTLALTYSGTALPVVNGGTGQTSYTDGQLLIGNSTGNTLSKATLTAGSNITITNSAGGITIASTGGSGVTSVTGTSPVVSSGGTTPAISMPAATTSVNGYLTSTDWNTFNGKGSGTVTSITAGTGLSGGTITSSGTIAIDSTVVTLTGTQTLTNKTLTAPKVDLINDTNGNESLAFSPTTSATDYFVMKNGIGVGAPIHLYADGSSANTGMHIQPKGTGLVTISDGTDFNKGIRFRSSSSAASTITLLDAVSTAGRVVTLPDATTTLVGRDTTDTLTNKSISGSTNTLSNIGNSSLTNSAITINGTSTSLGGSISVGTVTSVTGTAPVVSSGGATPAISMPAATTSVSGYLTNTDWTTFNNKGSGTVTAVSVASANGFAGTSSGGATPALTLTTSITGVLKGNGTAISAATSGTDYSAGTSALTTGILKSTTTTGALSIAVAADFPTLNQNTTGTASNVTGTVAIANGGTGETTRQNAMDALAGAVTSGQYLRGNGTDVVMSAIQAADVPTLNQNTTGTAAGLSSTLVATSGGTGQSTYAVGDLLQGAATNTLSKLAAVATGNALISGGVTTASSWGKIGLTTHVSGILPVANGGTNASAAGIAAFNNITGYTAAGATGTTSTNLVFSTSPTLVTPILGVASATSVNKVAITAPATSSTLTIADGSTLATSGAFSTTLTATGATNVTLPTTGTLATLAGSETLTNKTLTNPTITNYTETLFTVTGSATLALTNGTIQKVTTSGSTTITLPASATGKSFTVIVSYAAADSITWAGGTTIKWAGGTTPTPTSATGKIDIFNFYQDGTNTYGSIFGQNY